jgi:hypothetical protein
MKVIVSDILDASKYTRYMVMPNFKEVLSNAESISCVIIHHASSQGFDLGVYVSKLNEAGIKQFAYINSNPVGTIKMCVLALGGLLLEDEDAEDFLEDEDDLDVLLEEFFAEGEKSTELTSQSNIDVLSDFIQAFTRKDAKINTPIYIEQVNTALKELAVYTSNQDIVLQDFANTALDTFNKASTLITKMQETKQDLEEKLSKMEENLMKNNNTPATPKDRMNQAMFFSSYQYVGGAKVLQIREVSPCRYLTSYILGYKNWLSLAKDKRVKLIFCYSKSSCTGKKYNEWSTVITPESKNNKILYDAEIIATNTPNNSVMEELMHRKDDVIIVVDRLKGSQPILKKTGVVTLTAVSGATDIQRFGLKAQECIFPVTNYPDNFYCIPHIKGYPMDGDTRRARYMQVCSESYEKLATLMKID